MSYTLEQFSHDCRAALDRDAGVQGRQEIVELVQRACSDADFVDAHLGADNDSPRKLLYEDDRFGFCIFAHVYTGAQMSRPHDHGPSWAIYGQAVGVTNMTDWKVVERASGKNKGRVEPMRTYRLDPGDAHLYNEGDVHSPAREDSTRLIRIEGLNMDGVERSWYDHP